MSEGNIADAKSAADAASLGAFSVEPGSYTVYAVASSDEANLTFTGVAASNAVADARVKITDISAQIPELLVGNSDVVTVGAEGAAAALQLKRVVASVTVTVSGLENVDAESITLTIGNMYDQVSLDGAFSKSGAAFASKSLVLTKNAEGKFVGNAIVMPTDTEASNLSLTYSVNGTDYTSTPAGRIAANGQYELATTVEAGSSSSKVNLNSAITYAAWDSTVVNLSDSFTIDETTPDKQWMGPTALPISGTAAPGYDNFWASSDGGDSGWGETFWQYNLYDGNKTDGSNYWCPAEWDRTAPIWYINLGAAKQGVTIDYWNKAGGKGGQKIKTMDIYASNTRADYGGGNADWVKIMTFTSDKTTPTTDAGAQVTTGKIAFSEDGSVSYQYVKCVMTSKVNTDGATITDVLDVNVGELEVSTWEYK
ncbi:fimbrillin family protein, partial [Alistipes sp.]|uniref:fimbrillin family protein n=1 Tax=Alistipes sp. TaxID=1872444 RepID=UPI000E851CEB